MVNQLAGLVLSEAIFELTQNDSGRHVSATSSNRPGTEAATAISFHRREIDILIRLSSYEDRCQVEYLRQDTS